MAGHKLLVSDVDNTLLGDDRSLNRFASWYEHNRSHVSLVYASGRFYESILKSIDQTLLPRPCAIIGGVGSDMRLYPSGRPIFGWKERLQERWNADRVRTPLAGYERLELQPSEFQSSFKVSYFLANASPQELEMILADLREMSIDANLIYSSRRDLDLVPVGINKGSAASFMADYFGYEREDVIVCGDSANDLAMFNFGFQGIVVANAHSELAVLKNPLVYKSPHPFAAGVLDGLSHWLHADRARMTIPRYYATANR